MMSSQQPVALVTGCSIGGMGWYFCKHLRAKGYRVFATARRLDSMEGLDGLGCDLLVLDVTNSDSLTKAVTHVSNATNGRLDLLVNNAGRVQDAPVLTASMPDARALFDASFFGLVACTQNFSPLLIRTAVEQKAHPAHYATKPKVVIVGSTAATIPVPWSGFYGATKAAVHYISDVLRLEMAGFAPGKIGTKILGTGTAIAAATQDGNKELEEELYPNLATMLDTRMKLLYTDFSTEVDTWAAEQVDVMTRKQAPRYYISGAKAWMAQYLIPYLPGWMTDMALANPSGCDQVKYHPKKV